MAVFYAQLGMYGDAVEVLAHKYAEVDPLQREPGAVLPQNHPLVSYYRGYCRMKGGASGHEDFALAARQPAAYVFPKRPQTFLVLQAALKDNPGDAAAHYLLGALYLEGGMTDRAEPGVA